ncbi:MAG: YegS/Rv2252/BmrU family lipid kinase [Candidatus Elarobacter sp.]
MNRHSRHTDSEIDRLQESLAAHGLRVAAFHVETEEVDCQRLIKRAVKAGAPEILVGGGDGTMTHAVNVLANRKSVMGVLPFGTGNSFAQSLGIPLGDIDAAVAVIAGGNMQRVDLGVVNGTYFANFATIGLSSEIAGATPRLLKKVTGAVAYALSSIGPMLTHRPFRARIKWKGGRLDIHTQDIIVANGRFYGDTPVTPDATIVDRRLHLFTTDHPSTLAAARTYLALGRGQQAQLPGAHVVTARTFTVRTRKRQPIAIDGSPLEKTPAKFGVACEALRVFVPEAGVAHG